MKSAAIAITTTILCGWAVTGQCDESEAFDYRSVTRAELDGVRSAWDRRDLRAKNVEIVLEEEREEGLTLLIVRHDIASRAHFGAIFIPKVNDLSGAPVVVLPDGLEQYNPTIDVDQNIRKYQTFEPLDGFIRILPGFRGRFVGYRDNGWFSRGDFCDAYDGPTDDSIALLNVAEELIPEANFDKVLVWGGSRGANVAWLMAVRDPRVNTVIAAAGPVDFYRESWQVEGSDQYRCQFFDEMTEQQSRERMLASSPLFFAPHENLERAFIHHDEGDGVVHVWNAQEMAVHMRAFQVDVTAHIYATDAHGAMAGEQAFWRNMEAGITAFLAGIAE